MLALWVSNLSSPDHAPSNANLLMSGTPLLRLQPPPQQHPPFLRLPSSLNTASHSLIPLPHVPIPPPRPFRLLLAKPPSSIVVPALFTLPPSSHPPLSPYCIPLIGSSGSISPSSIFVNIIPAKRAKISSTPSPVYALTSTETGMADLDAHRDASSGVTSRPSEATVAVWREPKP